MILLLILFSVVSYLLLKQYLTVKRLPPGPTPLPLIGNLHQIAWGVIRLGTITAVLKQWRQEYGDVFTTWFGPLASVNIADYTIAHDVMVKKGASFANRPDVFIMDLERKGRGVVASNGQHWIEQRRFSLHTLRNFGLGRNLSQDRILLEYDFRTANLDMQIEKSGGSYNFDPYNFIELLVGNIINRMLFSDRFTEDKEKEFFRLKRATDKMIDSMGAFEFLLNEWTVKIPPFKQRYAEILKPVTDIWEFVDEQIQERKSLIASGKHELSGEGEDFVDAFFIHMKKTDSETSFYEESLKLTLFDLWIAGQETTATTLYWGLSYMIQHPQVVKTLQKELDSVTGGNRTLELSDKTATPYLNATITEILRLSALATLNALRVAAEDTIVGSYLIPKGTAITAQLSLLLADEKRFDEPKKFKPERHLGTGAEQYVIPFGIGKRACLGESLARAELYLILGNLFQTYDFIADPFHPAHMEALSETGAVRRCKPYHVTVSKRHHAK